MPNTVIIGSGSFIPERVIDGSHFMDTTFYDEQGEPINKPNEEIIQKFVEITEIKSRRYISMMMKTTLISLQRLLNSQYKMQGLIENI